MKLFSYITGPSMPVTPQYSFYTDPSTGWLTVIGWQATYATSCYLCGTLIQGLIVLTNRSYQPKNWHGTLLFWAVAVFSVAINSVGGKLLPRFEGFILILHILGFFAILIPLTYMADHGSAKEVFTEFLNLGEFPSQGLSFFVGMVGCIFAFAGGDAAVHVSVKRLRYVTMTNC
jgi:amino acid transporter